MKNNPFLSVLLVFLLSVLSVNAQNPPQQCLYFDGSNDLVNMGNILNSVIAGTNKQFTFEFLVNLNATDSYQTILSKFDAAANQRQFMLRTENISGNKLVFAYYNSLSGASNFRKIVGATALNVYEWYHIAVVYDGTINTNNGADRVKFYINGIQETTTMTYASGSLTGILAGTAPLIVGSTVSSGAPVANGSCWDGVLKNARIWDDLRTESEIQQYLYSPVPNPVYEPNLKLYLMMNEGSGQILTDLSSNGFIGYLGMNATITTYDPVWTNCIPPSGEPALNCLDFDGINDYVNAGDHPGFVMTNEMTIEAWIFPEGTGSGGAAGSGGIIVSKEGEYELARLESGYIGWAFGNTSPGWSWRQTTAFVPLFQWSHVTMTYGNDMVNTYLNGILQHSYAVSGPIGDVAPSLNNLWISGRQSLANGQIFDGKIEEVRIWNIVRSVSQIREDMHHELPSPLTSSGLVAYYAFNHQGGSVVLDSSPNQYTGTLTNMDPATDWELSTAPIPFNTIANGNWENNAVWNTGQNAPVNAWSRIEVDHAVTLNSIREAIDLNIGAAGSVTVDPGQSLSVSGSLVNQAGSPGLVLKSNSSGTATLIEDDGVQATIERYFSGNDPGWHMVSSPVLNAVSGVFEGLYLQKFNEISNAYIEITPLDVALSPGKGYALYSNLSEANTAVFEGSLNTGNINFPLTCNGTAPYGWNLAGNPYPCSLDWNAVMPSSGGINSTVYYLDAVSGNWLTWNGTTGSGSRYIPPMQGFFVSTPANATLGLNNSMKSHSGSSIFYKDEVSGLLVLKAAGNGFEDKTYIQFNDIASPDFDGMFDGWKIISNLNDKLPQVYSYSGELKLSVNNLPETPLVSVGFESGSAGIYTLSMDQTEDFENVILEDKMNGNLHDLKKSAYTFSYSPEDNPDRFTLYFIQPGSTSGDVDIQVYTYGRQVVVDARETGGGILQLFDLAGRIILSENIHSGLFQFIDVPAGPGIYLAVLKSEGFTRNTKVVIQ